MGPISHCGYVALINQSNNPNCTAVTAVVKGRIRILVFTNKNIVKDKQLFINYDWKTD